MSTITASTLNANDSAYSLEPLQFFFGHVGDRGFKCESVFNTSVSRGYSLSEHRRQLIGRPKVRADVKAVAFDRNEAMSLQMRLARMAQRRWLCPLFCDESPVTGSLSATDTTITCTTDYRRFYQGGRLVVYRRDRSYEVVTISSVGAGSLTVSALAGSYASPVYVAPLFEAELLPDPGGVYRFLHQYQAEMMAIGRVGPMAFPAIATANATPAGWTNHTDGLPIFDALRYMQVSGDSGWRREGDILDLGLGSMPEVLGDRALATYNIPLEFLNRADAWSYLQFAHSRAGRAYPFWLVSPSENFTLESTGTITSTIDVTAIGPAADWDDYRTHIAIVENDETVTIIALADATVSRASNTDTITLDTPLSPGIAVADIERIAIARKVRYDEDVISEDWLVVKTDETVMQSSMKAVELINEKDTTIANLTEVTTSGKAASCEPEGVAFDATCGIASPTVFYLLLDCATSLSTKVVTDATTDWSTYGGTFDSWADVSVGMVADLSGAQDCWEFMGVTVSGMPADVSVYGVYNNCANCEADNPTGGDEDGAPPLTVDCGSCTFLESSTVAYRQRIYGQYVNYEITYGTLSFLSSSASEVIWQGTVVTDDYDEGPFPTTNISCAEAANDDPIDPGLLETSTPGTLQIRYVCATNTWEHRSGTSGPWGSTTWDSKDCNGASYVNDTCPVVYEARVITLS